MKNGVPWEVSFGAVTPLEGAERKALCILMAMFEGGEFDWNLGRFKERRS